MGLRIPLARSPSRMRHLGLCTASFSRARFLEFALVSTVVIVAATVAITSNGNGNKLEKTCNNHNPLEPTSPQWPTVTTNLVNTFYLNDNDVYTHITYYVHKCTQPWAEVMLLEYWHKHKHLNLEVSRFSALLSSSS